MKFVAIFLVGLVGLGLLITGVALYAIKSPTDYDSIDISPEGEVEKGFNVDTSSPDEDRTLIDKGSEEQGTQESSGATSDSESGDTPTDDSDEVNSDGGTGGGLDTVLTAAVDITGQWDGSLSFTNNCPAPSCLYKGRLVPPSLSMSLVQTGNNVAGTVTIDFANFAIEELVQGETCGTFEQMVQQGNQIQSPILDGVVSSTHFTFADNTGNSWDLRVTNNLLDGTVDSDDPYCVGVKSNDATLSIQN